MRLLRFFHFFDPNVVASEEIEWRRQTSEVLALIGIVCERVVRVWGWSLIESIGEVDNIECEGKIALLRIAVASVEVRVALV